MSTSRIKKSPGSQLAFFTVASFNYIIIFADLPFEISHVEGIDESLQPFPFKDCTKGWKPCSQGLEAAVPEDDDWTPCSYSIALWALNTDTTYVVHLKVNEEEWIEKMSTTSLQRSFSWLSSIRLTSLITEPDMFLRDDVDRLIRAQGAASWLNLLWVPEYPYNFSQIASVLFYHSLFLLPSVSIKHGPSVFALPAPSSPYIIDLDRVGNPDVWKHSRKMKKLISSKKYVVRVSTDRDGILRNLACVVEYHTLVNGGTWLTSTFKNILAGVNEVTLVPHVQLVCFNIEDTNGEVFAGCCGVSCGSVYKDFTMYTLKRCPMGYGTLASKILAEALQRCGYNLWYWGFQLEYMQDFEGRYGARQVTRSEFLDRWRMFRDSSPHQTLKEYFEQGNGLLPHA
eukprot:gene5989-4295_t